MRRLREQSAYGYDEMARQTFFGLRAHLRVCWPGVIVGLCLTPANVHDLAGAQELLEQQHGFVLADRNYWPTATTGRPGSSTPGRSRACACWPRTSPASVSLRPGRARWCRSGGGLRP